MLVLFAERNPSTFLVLATGFLDELWPGRRSNSGVPNARLVLALLGVEALGVAPTSFTLRCEKDCTRFSGTAAVSETSAP